MELPFVGRDQELGALLRATRAAAVERRSRLVAIVGEPGIGKTLLLREFERRAPCGARFLWGRGSPLGKEVPFAALIEALESHLRELLPSEVLRLCAGRHDALSAVLPSVAAVTEPSDIPRSPLVVFEALLALLADMALDSPVVLLLDDAHQADPSTWEFLGYLGRNPIGAPVVVVMAARPEAIADRAVIVPLLRDGLAEEVRVGPLTPAELAHMAVAALGGELATDELLRWLLGRTRGNPLYTRGVLEDLSAKPSRRVVAASAYERARQVTASLAPAARAVLELGAAMGSSFALRDLVGSGGPDVGIDVDRLVVAGLLTVREEGEHKVIEFAHPVIQEAVYDGLGPGRRRDLHALLARTLPNASLTVRAYHVARSALPGDLDAVAVLVGAAGEAEVAQRHRGAIAQLSGALELLPPGSSERLQLLDRLAWQAACVGEHAVGVPALEELILLSEGDDLAEAGARMRLASFLAWGRGDVERAERHIRLALAGFEKVGAPDRVAAAINEQAWISGGDHLGRQIEASRDAGARAERLGDMGVLMRALGSLGHALAATGGMEEGVATLRRGLALAREAGDDDQSEWFIACCAEELGLAGRLEEAVALMAELDVSGRDASDMAYSRRAMVAYLGGRWTAALADCRAIQEKAATLPAALSAWGLSLGAVPLAAAGRGADATLYLGQAEEVYRGQPLYWFSARHDWAVGMTAWLLGDLDQAIERLDRSARRCREIGAVFREAHALVDLTDLLVTVGQLPEARVRAERLEECAAVLTTPFVDGLALFARGVVGLGSGDTTTGWPLLDKARRRLGGSPFLLARAAEHDANTRTGRQRIDMLSEAGRRYAALPAPVYEVRVAAQLRRLGGAGRRAAQTVGSLTPREHQVAELAGEGLTSPAIAQRLFVSERTIESHLERVYRKLGVSGRAGLTSDLLTEHAILDDRD